MYVLKPLLLVAVCCVSWATGEGNATNELPKPAGEVNPLEVEKPIAMDKPEGVMNKPVGVENPVGKLDNVERKPEEGMKKPEAVLEKPEKKPEQEMRKFEQEMKKPEVVPEKPEKKPELGLDKGMPEGMPEKETEVVTKPEVVMSKSMEIPAEHAKQLDMNKPVPHDAGHEHAKPVEVAKDLDPTKPAGHEDIKVMNAARDEATSVQALKEEPTTDHKPSEVKPIEVAKAEPEPKDAKLERRDTEEGEKPRSESDSPKSGSSSRDWILWSFVPDQGRSKLPVAVRVGDGYTEGKILHRYNGEDENKFGLWVVETAQGVKEVQADDLKVRVTEGLEVTDGALNGVVLNLRVPGNETDSRIMVKYQGVDDPKPVSPKVLSLLTKDTMFEEGDVVDVRDSEGKIWKVGVVESEEPLHVKVRGWRNAHAWNYIRHHFKAEPMKNDEETEKEAETTRFKVGDIVEVKDGIKGSWKHGTVSSVEDEVVRVLVDGWKKPHTWHFIRFAIEGAAEEQMQAEEPTVEPKTEEVPPPVVGITLENVTRTWENVCLQATCDRSDSEDCVPEYFCGNVSGCSWDSFDTPPCAKKLKIGDSVALAPGAHEQGSVRVGEVGVVTQVLSEYPQPYEVRGGYGDEYNYREDEIVPAWGKAITWVDPKYLNPVLFKWRGGPSFGLEAELLEGANVDPGYKTPPPEWEPEPGGAQIQPSPPLIRHIPPPPAQIPLPPPPPVPTASAQPPPAPLAGGSSILPPTAPPASLPVPPPVPPPPAPPVATPPKIGISAPTRAPIMPPTQKPKAAVPLIKASTAPPVVLVYVPDSPDICGEYELQKKTKIRNYALYISTSCATGECELFVSHGSYWMLGKNSGDAKANRGVFKSKDKVVKKSSPDTMQGWELLGEGTWQDSEGEVGLPEAFATKGLDVTMCRASMAAMEKPEEEMMEMMMSSSEQQPASPPPAVPPPPAGGGAVEKRMDTDGMYYTKEEFSEFYSTNEQWESRASTSTLNGGSSMAAAAAGGGTFEKDQAVVSTQDIILGNTLVVKQGGPGTIIGPSGNGKWQVSFVSVFAKSVNVSVDAFQIRAA